MSFIRIASTPDIRVYQDGGYRIIGAKYPLTRKLEYTLSYNATIIGVYPTLVAAKARATEHIVDRVTAAATLRRDGRI